MSYSIFIYKLPFIISREQYILDLCMLQQRRAMESAGDNKSKCKKAAASSDKKVVPKQKAAASSDEELVPKQNVPKVCTSYIKKIAQTGKNILQFC